METNFAFYVLSEKERALGGTYLHFRSRVYKAWWLHVMAETTLPCQYFIFVFSRILLAVYCYSYISIQKEYKNRISPYYAAKLDTVREAIFCFVA